MPLTNQDVKVAVVTGVAFGIAWTLATLIIRAGTKQPVEKKVK